MWECLIRNSFLIWDFLNKISGVLTSYHPSEKMDLEGTGTGRNRSIEAFHNEYLTELPVGLIFSKTCLFRFKAPKSDSAIARKLLLCSGAGRRGTQWDEVADITLISYKEGIAIDDRKGLKRKQQLILFSSKWPCQKRQMISQAGRSLFLYRLLKYVFIQKIHWETWMMMNKPL